MTNDTPTPQEYQMVRITSEAHAKLKELAENEKRSMGNQTEVLIEAAWNLMHIEHVFVFDEHGQTVKLSRETLQAANRNRQPIPYATPLQS